MMLDDVSFYRAHIQVEGPLRSSDSEPKDANSERVVVISDFYMWIVDDTCMLF